MLFQCNRGGVLKKDIFWDPISTHNWDKHKNKEWNHYPKNAKNYIFEYDKNNISFETVENNLQNIDSVQDKYQYILDTLVPTNKNRFYIGEKKTIKRNINKIIKKIRKKIKKIVTKITFRFH